MIPSGNRTIDNWPQSLREYATACKAQNKGDLDLPNFIEAVNGEHGKEHQEAMGIEMRALQQAIIWDIV